VVQAEAVFEFAIVVLDTPADLGQPYQTAAGSRAGRIEQPMVGGLGCAGRPLGQQPALGQAPVCGAGDVAVGRPHPQREILDRIAAVGLPGDFLDPWRHTTKLPADWPAS
jgi:hypothetical protein